MKKVTTAIIIILVAWIVFEIVHYASQPVSSPKVVLTVKEDIKNSLDKGAAVKEELDFSNKNDENNNVKLSEELNDKIKLVYPKDTQELEKLFANFNRQAIPRIFVGSFPDDFSQNGSPALFAKTLLPLILQENEKISLERKKLLPIVVKIRQSQVLNDEEKQFFDYLVTKYDVIEVGPLNQSKQLLERVDRISPALAITQALEQTKEGKDLTSIFGIYKWNDKDQFVYATYSNLQEAVADYALHLNTTVPYYVFWELRSLNRDKRQPMKARVFMDGLTSYRYGDRAYVSKLIDVFNKFGLFNLDDTQLEEEQ